MSHGHENNLNVTRVRPVTAFRKTTNLSLRALELHEAVLGHAPERERRALCCCVVPLGRGVEDSLGFDAPFLLAHEITSYRMEGDLSMRDRIDYDVFGPFKVPSTPKGLFDNSGAAKKKFWETVDREHEGLSEAHGCYIISVCHRVWYVGLADASHSEWNAFTWARYGSTMRQCVKAEGMPTCT